MGRLRCKLVKTVTQVVGVCLSPGYSTAEHPASTE